MTTPKNEAPHFNAILGHPKQNAVLNVTEAEDAVSGLLAGERKTEWDAASLEDRQAAVRAVAKEIEYLSWRGARMFPYQALPLPTNGTVEHWTGLAKVGSDSRVVALPGMHEVASRRLVGGALHIGDGPQKEFLGASRIVASDAATGVIALAEPVAEGVAGEFVTFITPLPLAIRRAFAIQAADYLNRREAHELAMEIGCGAPNKTAKVVWHPEAFWLCQPYLNRGI